MIESTFTPHMPGLGYEIDYNALDNATKRIES
jgi:hypothetical protein